MMKSLSRSLVRFSLFLLLISAVGLAGLNNGLNPRNVTRIQAHDIVIELTSNSGNTLSFGVTANCVPTAMAPGESCVAGVLLQNTGEGAYTLSAPAVTTSGALAACGGGGWFGASISLLSYAPNVEVIDVGNVESFNVTASLNLATPNDCQGLTGLIVITLVATATDEATPTPTATSTPTLEPGSTSTPTAQPTSQVQGARATPEPTRTATARPATATPAATFIAEVLPSRFPSTGQGGVLSDSTARAFKVLFLGIGLLAAGMLFTAAAVRAKGRSDS